MTPGEFKSWRKSLGLKQKDIADLLGLKKRVIQYYEKGGATESRWKFRAPSSLPAMPYR